MKIITVEHSRAAKRCKIIYQAVNVGIFFLIVAVFIYVVISAHSVSNCQLVYCLFFNS